MPLLMFIFIIHPFVREASNTVNLKDPILKKKSDISFWEKVRERDLQANYLSKNIQKQQIHKYIQAGILSTN